MPAKISQKAGGRGSLHPAFKRLALGWGHTWTGWADFLEGHIGQCGKCVRTEKQQEVLVKPEASFSLDVSLSQPRLSHILFTGCTLIIPNLVPFMEHASCIPWPLTAPSAWTRFIPLHPPAFTWCHGDQCYNPGDRACLSSTADSSARGRNEWTSLQRWLKKPWSPETASPGSLVKLESVAKLPVRFFTWGFSQKNEVYVPNSLSMLGNSSELSKKTLVSDTLSARG